MAKKRSTPEWALGRRIRYLRQSRGLTMSALIERAKGLGLELPWRTLSDLERGQRKDPRLSTLLAVAGGLGVELTRLVEVLDQEVTPSEEEHPMTDPKNPIAVLRQKIGRKDFLVRKWTKEAEAYEGTDPVGQAVKRYCLGLARWQQEERDRLEAEMRKLMQQ
jgi:transcriptional regulator with XRE-family HTH domain